MCCLKRLRHDWLHRAQPWRNSERDRCASGLDRLPVLRPEDQPAGLVNILDILLDQNGNRPLGDYVRRIVTTTEEEPAYRIVQQLRAARLGLAVVVDQKKNFSGIVTIDDLIRRLVSSGSI